jgi:hypothetical protein
VLSSECCSVYKIKPGVSNVITVYNKKLINIINQLKKIAGINTIVIAMKHHVNVRCKFVLIKIQEVQSFGSNFFFYIKNDNG